MVDLADYAAFLVLTMDSDRPEDVPVEDIPGPAITAAEGKASGGTEVATIAGFHSGGVEDDYGTKSGEAYAGHNLLTLATISDAGWLEWIVEGDVESDAATRTFTIGGTTLLGSATDAIIYDTGSNTTTMLWVDSGFLFDVGQTYALAVA